MSPNARCPQGVVASILLFWMVLGLPGQGGPPCEVRTIRNLANDGERLGYVAAVGDLDRDGVPDFLLGATGGGANGGGYARIISGKTTMDFAWRIEGPARTPGVEGGVAACPAWDVDHDGWPDFVVGWSHAGINREGRVDLHSGRDGTILRSWTGANADDNFGHSVASNGDVNHDLRCDIVVGALQYTGTNLRPGYACVYDAEDGHLLTTLTQLPSSVPGANFGQSVAIVPGLNNDPYDDILVSASATQIGQSNCIQAFLGGPAGGAQLGQLHYSVYGTSAARIGGWLRAADLDGDMVKDYVTSSVGGVTAYSGAAQGRVIWQTTNPPPGSEFGAQGDLVRDVDNDGVVDVVASGTYGGTPGHVAFVRVLSGATGAVIQEILGLPSVSYYGGSIASSGNSVSTESADFFVGAPYDPNGGTQPLAQRGTAVLYTVPGGCARYGEGCPDDVGMTPRLRCVSSPRVNGTLSLRADRIAPLLPTAGAWMLSGQRAELSLAYLNMPGCVLLDAADLFLGFATNGLGESTLSISITDPALAGQCLYSQVLALDPPPSANPRGLIVSNGVVAMIAR